MPGGASVSDWHRKQHKKQQQKNKAERIAARDKAVVDAKTEREIQEEIRNLLKPHKSIKDESLLPHGVKSRLDRLRKELRLVQEHAKQQPRPTVSSPSVQASDQRRSQQGLSFQKLENPQISVYYDPVMNPYGAPPPGQPMLYHRRGGGVTMNINEANWVPTTVHHQQQSEPGSDASGVQSTSSSHEPSRALHSSNDRASPPPKPRPPPPPPPPPPPRVVGADRVQPRKREREAPKPAEPEVLVHRPRRKILDVWAHEEEKELIEEVENEGEMGDAESSTNVAPPRDPSMVGESTASRQRSSETKLTGSTISWYYRDQGNQVQGPYDTSQMQQWIDAGYFPGSTQVQPASHHPSHEPPWSTLDKQPPFCTHFSSTPSNGTRKDTAPSADENASDDDSIQARIAALKADGSPRSGIAQNEQSGKSEVVDRVSQPELEGNAPVESSVQDRIAALRDERMRESSEISAADKNHRVTSSVQERIMGLRQSLRVNSPPTPPPPLPPPPPPVGADEASLAEHGYYPVDDLIPSLNEYPVDDEVNDGEHEAIPATGMYPVTDAYPLDDDDDMDDEGFSTKQHQYQADTEVVALRPSHLQKRRLHAREPNADKVVASASGPIHELRGSRTPTDGDLDKFFEEVEN